MIDKIIYWMVFHSFFSSPFFCCYSVSQMYVNYIYPSIHLSISISIHSTQPLHSYSLLNGWMFGFLSRCLGHIHNSSLRTISSIASALVIYVMWCNKVEKFIFFEHLSFVWSLDLSWMNFFFLFATKRANQNDGRPNMMIRWNKKNMYMKLSLLYAHHLCQRNIVYDFCFFLLFVLHSKLSL